MLTRFRRNSPATPGAIAAITIVLYQGWFLPFFQPFFAGRVEFARIVFYALYGSLALTAAAIVLAPQADIRRRIAPCAVVGVVAVAVTALHPIGLVTRAYIISVIVGGATVVLMLGAASEALLQLAAAVTALNAVLCLVDLLFPFGFTNTIGRAAGLAINPNDAAASILLGAAASYRAVPRRFQLSFVVLTAGSLAVTLSRSTFLVAGASLAIPAAVAIWRRAGRQTPWTSAEVVRPAALVAACIIVSVAVAAVTNPYFRTAVRNTAVDSVTFAGSLETAYKAIGSQPSDSARIAALDARLSGEGARNSMSARTLYLDRALLAYRNDGALGIGLEQAQSLAPHNTFLLFALAFGHLGWFIPLAVLGLTLYTARDARDLPLSVAALGTMATSHDILLMPSLFLPIAVGIGGMIARGPVSDPDRRGVRSIAFAASAAVVLFAGGCLAIVYSSPPVTETRLAPEAITRYHGAYLVYFPTQTFPGLFVPAVSAAPGEGDTFLREDSLPLTRTTWRPGLSSTMPRGEYAVVNDGVVFAPADGSDPRTGGHVVDLGLRHEVGLSFYALLAALAAWCTGVIIAARPTQSRP